MDREQLADWAEAKAQESLDKALKWAGDHGPDAGIGDLISAGALLRAADELRKKQ